MRGLQTGRGLRGTSEPEGPCFCLASLPSGRRGDCVVLCGLEAIMRACALGRCGEEPPGAPPFGRRSPAGAPLYPGGGWSDAGECHVLCQGWAADRASQAFHFLHGGPAPGASDGRRAAPVHVARLHENLRKGKRRRAGQSKAFPCVRGAAWPVFAQMSTRYRRGIKECISRYVKRTKRC